MLQKRHRGDCKLLTDVLRASYGHPSEPSAHSWGKKPTKPVPSQKLELSPWEDQGTSKETSRGLSPGVQGRSHSLQPSPEGQESPFLPSSSSLFVAAATFPWGFFLALPEKSG